MKRYKYLLLERTFDIDKDIDLLYNNIFKNYIEQLKNKTFKEKLNTFYPIINSTGFLCKSIDSKILQESDCKLANDIKPIYIIGGIFDIDSKIVLDKKIENRNYIIISVNKDLIELYINNNFSFKKLSSKISDKQIQFIVNSLKESYIKAMIYHELSHWLNDTLHNDHITKVVELSKKYNNVDILKLKTKDVNLTYFEIDAQIHAIKQYRRDNIKIWDKLTLYQLFKLYPSLLSIYDDVKEKYGETIKDIWVKNLVKRMSRENLLGKKMEPYFLDSFDIH